MTYENIGNELENNAEYFEARKYYLLSKKYGIICKNHLIRRLSISRRKNRSL